MWFGFSISVKPGSLHNTDLARELDKHKIGNRMLFGGNLVRQPAFVQLKYDRLIRLEQLALWPVLPI